LSINRKELDRAFNPHCVAVVGDKRGYGYVWLRSLSTFTGKLYSVQIDPEELPGIESMGIPNYFSLLDIPEPVDYVLIAVPQGSSPSCPERLHSEASRRGSTVYLGFCRDKY
jgi:acyl-CoA synthetase (NDP forming)